jgi:mRNA interferase MazF
MNLQHEPDRGDIVWLDFNPQAGHEQAGKRPALVLSPKFYNLRSGLALFCPITSKIKPYPYVIVIPADLEVKGVVLSDQVKSFDWKARRIKFICKMPPNIVNEVIDKFSTLIK